MPTSGSTSRAPSTFNAATEPTCVGESHVQDYQTDLRQGVVSPLRPDLRRRRDHEVPAPRSPARPLDRPRLPEGWLHPLHTDDVGTAVVAALDAPSGVYNVGAEPVRRVDLLRGFADAAGRDAGLHGTGAAAPQRPPGRAVHPVVEGDLRTLPGDDGLDSSEAALRGLLVGGGRDDDEGCCAVTGDRSRQQAAAEQRRRMAAVFGDPLPERTRTSCPRAVPTMRRVERGDDDWLRSQVPPHHGLEGQTPCGAASA